MRTATVKEWMDSDLFMMSIEKFEKFAFKEDRMTQVTTITRGESHA